MYVYIYIYIYIYFFFFEQVHYIIQLRKQIDRAIGLVATGHGGGVDDCKGMWAETTTWGRQRWVPETCGISAIGQSNMFVWQHLHLINAPSTNSPTAIITAHDNRPASQNGTIRNSVLCGNNSKRIPISVRLCLSQSARIVWANRIMQILSFAD